ncbi:MAG TPA: zinc dependent phospholipase C family protein [Candidatus Kryptonia bacterium]|nr:zinc dependent phospholipase C family protein [Candidatus Kryptonia bacterium]
MTLLWLGVLTVALLAPSEALAWGPITHLAHGSAVLQNLNIASRSLQDLLTLHPLEYLYGCIGADITQAKKYTRAMAAHCHSWFVGWQVRAAAKTDAQRAFAYGYLSHLAADVFSHNHYVPTQLIVSYPARTLRHVYWEARFDSLQNPQLRELMGELRRGRFRDCDALVEHEIARTLFSFRTNKRIFNSVLAWQGFEQWHRVMLTVDARSRFALPPDVIPRYNQLCQENILSLLRRGKRAPITASDPTGRAALTQAMEIRQTLRWLRQRGRITPALRAEIEALQLRPEVLKSSAAVLRSRPLLHVAGPESATELQ